jgi:hypothetical protein
MNLFALHLENLLYSWKGERGRKIFKILIFSISLDCGVAGGGGSGRAKGLMKVKKSQNLLQYFSSLTYKDGF